MPLPWVGCPHSSPAINATPLALSPYWNRPEGARETGRKAVSRASNYGTKVFVLSAAVTAEAKTEEPEKSNLLPYWWPCIGLVLHIPDPGLEG